MPLMHLYSNSKRIILSIHFVGKKLDKKIKLIKFLQLDERNVVHTIIIILFILIYYCMHIQHPIQ